MLLFALFTASLPACCCPAAQLPAVVIQEPSCGERVRVANLEWGPKCHVQL